MVRSVSLCASRTIITPQYQYILNLNPEKTFRTVTTDVTRGMGAWSKFYDPFWDSWVTKAKTDKHAAAIVHTYRHRPREELYDLIADPYEMHNVVNDPKLAGIRRELRQQLSDWCRQQGDTEPLKYLKP
jgi:N-sulfoglucosamine sulfohydrolase